jgi:hypothetical protein
MLVPQEEDKDVDTATESRQTGRHAAKDGAGLDPLIDLNRDPTPGFPDHAAQGDD